MNNHLSDDQFARCVVGRPTGAELQHTVECPECRAELERFAKTLSLCRSAIRDRIDDRVASHPSDVTSFPIRHAEPGAAKWRWAFGAVVAVVLVLITIPFFKNENGPRLVYKEVSPTISPDAIMNAMNRHLSRSVPAPMEPAMVLIPHDESTTETGGVQ